MRVFVVDDHPAVRRQVTELLDEEPDITVVGQAASVAEALALIPAAAPDVAVLDVRLPDGDGIGLCRELLTLMPDLHCLMLTSYTDEPAMTEALLAGAAGFLHKDVKGMELVDAVRAVGAGRSMLDGRATAALINHLRARSESSTDTAPLTGQETTMLDLIGEGLTNRQIAERTQQSSTAVADGVGRLVAKLGPDPAR
ncbi:response regulator [Nakamurella sp. GG22]